MEAPPGVACMDTRHPRRLLTSGQAQIPHPLIMTKPQLVEVLSSQVEMLRAELDEAHAANRENRRIIAGLVERIPVIEAPAEPRGSSETASEGAEPRSATGAPEEARERPFTSERQAKPSDGSAGPERRGFWSRLFGGGG